jgi:hypothetical protein
VLLLRLLQMLQVCHECLYTVLCAKELRHLDDGHSKLIIYLEKGSLILRPVVVPVVFELVLEKSQRLERLVKSYNQSS